MALTGPLSGCFWGVFGGFWGVFGGFLVFSGGLRLLRNRFFGDLVTRFRNTCFWGVKNAFPEGVSGGCLKNRFPGGENRSFHGGV